MKKLTSVCCLIGICAVFLISCKCDEVPEKESENAASGYPVGSSSDSVHFVTTAM
jgi:hypothetical protein